MLPEPEDSREAGSTPVVRTGSTLYYALLQQSERCRQDIAVMLRCCQVLAQAFVDVSDVQVLQQKHQWWQSEIDSLQTGTPHHPALVAIQPLVRSDRIGVQGLVSIVENAAAEWHGDRQDQRAFFDGLQQDYGSRLQMVCTRVMEDVPGAVAQKAGSGNGLTETTQASGFPTDATVVLSASWAIGLGVFDRLVNYRRLLHRGYRVFPIEAYQRFGLHSLDNRQILRESQREALGCLFAEQIDLAVEHLQAGARHERDQPRTRCRALLVYGDIRTRQLQRWRSEPALVYQQYQGLTPIRKAWIAWRCK